MRTTHALPALLALVLPTVPFDAAPDASAAPPPSRIEPVVDRIHGTEIVDPYRWLEGGDAPELEGDAPDLDAEVAAWTDAQNAYTRSVLDALPGRTGLEERLTALMEVGRVLTPDVRGDRYFTWKRDAGQKQWVVTVQDGLEGDARVLLDPNVIDPSGLLALEWTEPSPDGSLLAFGTFRAGDENTTLHVLDVETGLWLPDEVPQNVSSLDWLPDSKGFFYRCLGDVDDPYSGQVRFHRLGTHVRHDDVLFRQYTEGPLATTWGPFASVSPDARWMILSYATSTSALDVWVVDLDRWFRTGEFVRADVLVGEDAWSMGSVLGDTLFLQTTFGAANGRIVAIDLNRPARENWSEIVPERDDVVIQSFGLARGMLVVDGLRNASSVLERFALDGSPLGALELPSLGTASVRTYRDRTEAFYSFESFGIPDSIYRVDLATGESALWSRIDVPVDPSLVETRQVWFTSKDGTRVPMFLVHRKGLEKTGEQPTLLSGYGGFRVSRTPGFKSTLFPWLEAGGIYALVNLRGGGEFGEPWHKAGMMDRKQNVFDDFLAAAEHLVDEGWTNPDRLAVEGGSNGGLLTGAVLVQRPDLYSAVISDVPLLDMLRYQNFLMARYWVPEYGSAEDPEQFETLAEYSPYHHVREGVEYPAVFLRAGENDRRVHALHARKMAARLQSATASDPGTDPVLLWVDRDSGHGQGKPLHLRVRDTADETIFLMWQLGMLVSTDTAEPTGR